MKKLFSLLTLALLTLSAWGTTVTFTAGTTVGSNTAANSADEMTLDGVTIKTTKGAFNAMQGTQAQYRFGQGSTTTFTSTVGNITKVEINCTASYGNQYGPDKFSGNGYSAQSGSPVGTWTGDATEFTLSASAQVRATEIVVTIADATSDELVPPVFNPNGGEFTGSIEVSLTCATPNAEIQYYECDPVTHEIDWTTYHYYTQPFYVNETKTFAAQASKGGEVSEYAYATFTKVLPTCATPTFDPADGATFNEGEMLSVVISSATEGATITYSVNDDIFEGTTPVTVPVDMTTTITAMASKEGYNDSEEATATYTMLAPYNVGGTATFVAGVDADPNVEYRKEADLTIVKDNVTMKFHGTHYNYYNVGADGDTTWTYTYRIYKGQDITFTSAAGNIRKIEFDCESSNPITGFNAVDGLNMETATWEGNAREVTFNAGSKQVRCYTITVTLDDDVPSIIVADPVFTPATNTRFAGTQQVAITCETQGAAIYYNVNDGDYQSYNAPITLTETSTVKAYAEIEGIRSNIVAANYTKLVEVSSIAQANALDSATYFIFYGNPVVTYRNGNRIWIQDETGYGLIFGNQVSDAVVEGATLEEEWNAQFTLFHGMTEFQYPNDVNVTDDALVEIAATEYPEAEIDYSKLHQRILLKGVSLVANQDPKYMNTADGLTIFNQFNITYPTDLEGKTYDIEAMVGYYNGLQILPISITLSEGQSTCAAPSLPAATTFTDNFEVTITNNEEGATVYYALNDGDFQEYTVPFTLTETTTVKAYATLNGVNSEEVTATYTKVEPAVEQTFALVTDAADLADGDKIILVSAGVAGEAYAMGAAKTSNYGVVDVTIAEDLTITTDAANVITLEAQGENWAMKANEGYLYAAGAAVNKNQLKAQAEIDSLSIAAITVNPDSAAATIVFVNADSRNYLRFNINIQSEVANPLFNCYNENSTVQTPAYIFKVKEEAAGLVGDVNNDNVVNITDVTTLISAVMTENFANINTTNADLNGDNIINITDVTMLINKVMAQ